MESQYPKQVFFTNGMFMVMKNETEENNVRKEHPQWFFADKKEIKTETIAAEPVVEKTKPIEEKQEEMFKRKPGRPRGT
jgi:hypothetical protein